MHAFDAVQGQENMLRILVIEDSPVNMALTVAILENAGHVVLQADHAAEGMEMARREQPDLVLMDIQLPDIDGLAATRMLKADPRTAHLPVIALTAFAMKGDEDDTRAAGCDGYVTKPIRYKEFLAEMDAVMKRRAASASR
jgi:two-component system cell cycle response regulator DivK